MYRRRHTRNKINPSLARRLSMHTQQIQSEESGENLEEKEKKVCRLSPIAEETSPEMSNFYIIRKERQRSLSDPDPKTILDDMIVEDLEEKIPIEVILEDLKLSITDEVKVEENQKT